MTASFGPFTLLPDERRLVRDGRDLHLTRKAFDLLCLLVDAAPRVLSKSELHGCLWPDTFVSDATLVGLVKDVRRVLGEHGPDASVVRTVTGVGYGMAVPVRRGGPRRGPVHVLVTDRQSFYLAEGASLIGRAPSSAVWVEEGGVSRHHATVVVADHRATIHDAGSKNGTTVNGEPVSGSVVLSDGDVIGLGAIRLLYRSSAIGGSTETRPSGAASGRTVAS